MTTLNDRKQNLEDLPLSTTKNKKTRFNLFFKAGLHYGHLAKDWNPKMFKYIHSEYNGYHMIDLLQTDQALKKAAKFTRVCAESKKTFLFIGTKKEASKVVAQQATRCGAFYVNHRWLGGMLTNWETMKKRIQRLKDLEKEEKTTNFSHLVKKEAAKKYKELEKLRKYLNGVKHMEKLPDVVVVADQMHELIGIKEAIGLKIPVICLVDTDADPDLTFISVPGNDDTVKSLKVFYGVIANNIIKGYMKKI